ncbi:MAG: glycosyltransferase family 2 protein [Ignavibacteriales bacterium]|nr:glycosyltransferase family 2 protein [Ignavibacteriales bacterium]
MNCNRDDDTIACLQSLKQVGELNVNIILVDNGTDPNPEQIYRNQFPNVVFLRNDKNLGTPIGNNIGIRYALEHGSQYVMMLNNDTIVSKNFLWPLLDAMETNNSIGVAAGKVYFHSNPTLIWFARGVYNRFTTQVKHFGIGQHDPEMTDYVPKPNFISGCYALFRASVLKTVGVLDERFFAYMEDVDLCLRARERAGQCFSTIAVANNLKNAYLSIME